MKKKVFKLLILILSICMLALSVVTVPNVCMLVNAYGCIDSFDNNGDDKYDCILVLGAGLRNDGTPSDMLEDRLKIAINLYNEGYSDIILLSGDRSGDHYDEVSAMREYCLDNGVPSEDILCDNFGFSTYESLYNTAKMQDVERVIVVTQSYHLYRALYIAEKMGLDVCGASADLRGYRKQMYREIREILARTKDFYKVIFFE